MALNIACLLLTTGISSSSAIFAYVDPGTGNILMQGLLVSVLGALAAFKLFWKKVRDLIVKIFVRDKSTSTRNC